MDEKEQETYIILTPAGVFEAFSHTQITETQTALQSLLSHKKSWIMDDWSNKYGTEILEAFLSQGWVQQLSHRLAAPSTTLDNFLPYVIVSLSGGRKAALGSNEGFCLARSGYSVEEAEKLCVAGADYFEFMNRQRQRGLTINERAISLFSNIDLLMPSTTFIFLCIDNSGYILVLDGEPLTNSQAFVKLVWAIKTSGLRFNSSELDIE